HPRRAVPLGDEFRAGQSALHTRAHHAGVVLHSLLRDPARGAGSAHGGAPHAARRGVVLPPAVARPLAGEVHALSGLDLAHGAGALRVCVRRARVPRAPAGDRSVRGAGAHFHGALFRVLLADALLHAHRSGQARAREGDLPCALSSPPAAAIISISSSRPTTSTRPGQPAPTTCACPTSPCRTCSRSSRGSSAPCSATWSGTARVARKFTSRCSITSSRSHRGVSAPRSTTASCATR